MTATYRRLTLVNRVRGGLAAWASVTCSRGQGPMPLKVKPIQVRSQNQFIHPLNVSLQPDDRQPECREVAEINSRGRPRCLAPPPPPNKRGSTRNCKPRCKDSDTARNVISDWRPQRREGARKPGDSSPDPNSRQPGQMHPQLGARCPRPTSGSGVLRREHMGLEGQSSCAGAVSWRPS